MNASLVNDIVLAAILAIVTAVLVGVYVGGFLGLGLAALTYSFGGSVYFMFFRVISVAKEA